MYGVETKRVNEAVANNPEKFPERHILQLDKQEFTSLRSKFSTLKKNGRGQHCRRTSLQTTHKRSLSSLRNALFCPHTYGVRPFARGDSFSTEPFSPDGLKQGRETITSVTSGYALLIPYSLNTFSPKGLKQGDKPQPLSQADTPS